MNTLMFEFLKAFFYGKQFIYKFDRWKKKKESVLKIRIQTLTAQMYLHTARAC